MNYYTAYDLTIRSAYELPELPTIEKKQGNRDVEIRRSDVEPVPESVDGSEGRRIMATPNAIRLTYDSIGSFLVQDGNRIICDPISEKAVKRESFRRLIENELLGLILLQRAHLVLHASAVSIDGHGVIFLGPRGAGKSTTAAAFHVSGYPILEDDVVAIRFENGTPVVVPGVPQLRLRPDAATALDVATDSVPSSESWYEKRYLHVDTLPDPAPLRNCYVLETGDDVVIEQVDGSEQLLELISRTHARGLLGDTGQSVTHFDQCSRILETVRFHVLKRPMNHRQLPSLVNKIAEDTLPSNSPKL